MAVVLIVYFKIMLKYIEAFWDYSDGVIITIFYIALVVVIYKSVVEKLIPVIENADFTGDITSDITITINRLLAVGCTGVVLMAVKKGKATNNEDKEKINLSGQT